MRAVHCRLWSKNLLLGLVAAVGLSLPAAPQTARADRLSITRINTDDPRNIKVYAGVFNEEGAVIPERTAANFRLLLDAQDQGTATALQHFEKNREPVSVVLIAQVSGADRPAVLTAAKAGLRRVGQALTGLPGSDVSVLSYAAGANTLLEAGKPAALDGALRKLTADTAAEPHLLDALRSGVDLLKAQPAGRRKLIVVLSDGNDVAADKKPFVDVGRAAQLAGIVIDTIGYNPGDGARLRNLREITRRSYGTDRVATSVAEIEDRFNAVADEISKQYIATFRLSVDADDKEHTFQIVDESNKRPIYSNATNLPLPRKK